MKKFIFSMMAAVTICSLLTACDDDDDGAGSTVYNADATVLTTADGEKILVTECDSYIYSYNDNGHLTYISDNDGGLGSYDVSWDPFTFECEEDEGNSTVSLTTNGNGFVTKTVYSENFEDSWEEWQDT